MKVSIAWACGDRVTVTALPVPDGCTVGQALEEAGRGRRVPDEVLQALGASLSVAVFGRPAGAQTPLHEGDRIELLAPLRVDPKLARQRRVSVKRAALARDKWRPGG